MSTHPRNRRMVTGAEARPLKKQHKTPCADCPFARKSMKGWLGRRTVDYWVWAAHSEAQIDCHTVSNQQCAGAAIYRANVCKLPLPPQLILEPNKNTVFASMSEFRNHHTI